MSHGEVTTHVAIWCALLAYFVVTARGLLLRTRRTRSRPTRWGPVARWIWTVGCVAYLVHVICAFHFYHDWSHDAALEDTAQQTAVVTGWRWGGGLYVNYAFTAAWVGDVLWQWLAPKSHRQRSRLLNRLWHGSFFFIVFNATVVFEVGLVRWCGAFGCGVLLVLYLRRRLLRQETDQERCEGRSKEH